MSWQLHPDVLNPAKLLGQLERVLEHRATKPRDRQVPQADLDLVLEHLSAAVSRPQQSAGSEQASAGPPASVHLASQPQASMFQSVISHCVDPALRVDELIEPDPLRHWARAVKDLFRQFGPCDPRWIESRLNELLTAAAHDKHPFVAPPTTPVRLADDVKIVLVGDWATGLPQAANVAHQIEVLLQAGSVETHLIHLGDTYYSGLPEEYENRFLPLWPRTPRRDVRSWALNGNHDMYSGGHGFFRTLLRDDRFAAQAGASMFWLANQDWQIVGLDSSYEAPDDPHLSALQIGWLRDVLDDGEQNSRRTILLSHHQAFGAYEDKPVRATLAENVAEALQGRHVAAWFWGHEHRCTIYNRSVVTGGYDSLAEYTATIGHGGVPNLTSGPAAGPPVHVDTSLVAWQWDGTYTVEDDTWGLGGFAVVTLNRAANTIDYVDENGTRRRTDDVTRPGT